MTTNDITTATELDLATWCRDRADNHLLYEDRELAMYPTPRSRDIALVEWTVRCLANPNLDTAREALALIADQHDDELNPRGTNEWFKNRVRELTAELAEVREQLTAANRRADGLQADLDSAQRGLTEYANENAGLRPVVEAAKTWAVSIAETGDYENFTADELLAIVNALPKAEATR